MTLADNHKKIAEGLVRTGLLGDGCWHDWIEIGPLGEETGDYMCANPDCDAVCYNHPVIAMQVKPFNPSLNPDRKQNVNFDKNANEVMRRWKETEGYADWVEENTPMFGVYWETINILTTPELFIMIIWESVKGGEK